jgi:hypothetical protein
MVKARELEPNRKPFLDYEPSILMDDPFFMVQSWVLIHSSIMRYSFLCKIYVMCLP